jgi:hypothetical protein
MVSLKQIPNVGMKLVPAAVGGFHLVVKHPVGNQLITVAHVLETSEHGPGEAEAFGTVLCGAFLMLHAMGELIEYAQPECWEPDTDDAPMWRAAWRAHCVAVGEPIPQMLLEENHSHKHR